MTTSQARPSQTCLRVSRDSLTPRTNGRSFVAIAEESSSCESAVLITAAITAESSSPLTSTGKKWSATAK